MLVQTTRFGPVEVDSTRLLEFPAGLLGFARARREIWVGTGALLFLALMSYVVTALPAGCKPETRSGVEYQNCGGVYYRAAFQGNNLVYVVQ